MSEFDDIIVGGGPGGYVAAIRERQLGLSTALVEREHLGGICLNWGCIPTKSLLHTADLLREIRRAGEFGLQVDGARYDTEAVVKRSREVAGRLSRGVGHLMKKNGVEVFEGVGRVTSPGCLAVETAAGAVQELQSDAIVLATGARARSLPGIEPDGDRVWTYREAMVPSDVPESLLVIGSGAIGIEFASFYTALGSQVSVVEILPTILPTEDAEISALARKSFEREGMEIHTDARVSGLTTGDTGVSATIETKDGAQERSFDRAILSVGVTGNVEGLGLEGTGVEIEGGFIRTDGHCETGEPGIYAIGDVAGAPCLAHKASHEGTLVVEHLAGEPVHPIRSERIPGCTYASPQIASVGLTEAEASEEGLSLRVGRFPLVGNGKAIAVGEPDGLVKTIFDAETGELLGAHMVGPDVTEMIQGFVIAMGLEATEAELIDTIVPHPTISEAMHESVLDAVGRVIHV